MRSSISFLSSLFHFSMLRFALLHERLVWTRQSAQLSVSRIGRRQGERNRTTSINPPWQQQQQQQSFWNRRKRRERKKNERTTTTTTTTTTEKEEGKMESVEKRIKGDKSSKWGGNERPRQGEIVAQYSRFSFFFFFFPVECAPIYSRD